MKESHPSKANQQTSAEDTDNRFESKDEETREEVERRKVAILLKEHMCAVEQSEKSFEQERQRLSELYEKFYQTLGDVMPKRKTKLLGTNNSSAVQNLLPPTGLQKIVNFFSPSSSPARNTRDIQVLRGKIHQNQKEISGLNEKQQNLIKDVLTIFERYKNQSDQLLQQLEKEKTVNVIHLQQCRTLFKNANEKVEKLKAEITKKISNFEVCRSYIADAGKLYQLGYSSIIALIEQQPALKSMEITVDQTNVAAGGNVHIGPMTINRAKKELQDMLEDKQKAFEGIKAEYDALEQDYQKNIKDLRALKLQQAGLSQREQALLDRLTKAQQYAQNAKIKAEEAEKQMNAMQKRIAQLEAEVAEKTAEVHGIQPNLSPAEQGLVEEQKKQSIVESVLRESQYDEDRALALTLKELESENSYNRRAAWKMSHILARNPRLSGQQTAQIFAIAIAGLENEKIKYKAWETLIALASSARFSEKQITSIIAGATVALTDEVPGVQEHAKKTLAALVENPHLVGQEIAQILNTATVGLQNKDKNAWKILAALAGSSHLSTQQIAQILTTATASLQDEDGSVRAAAQGTLAALASNPHLSDQQIAAVLAATITGLEDQCQDIRDAVQQTLLALTGIVGSYAYNKYNLNLHKINLRLSEQQIAQIVTAITTSLKNENYSIRTSAQNTLSHLAKNPLFFESQTAQILATTIVSLKDEYWNVRYTGHIILSILAGNAHLSDQQVAQLLFAAAAGLKDGESGTRSVSQGTPISLAGNSRLTESQVAQIFATVTIELRDKDKDVRLAAWKRLAALACNKRLSDPQIVHIFATATSGLKERDMEIRRAAQEALTALVDNPRSAKPQITQIFSTITAVLRDADVGVQQAAWKTLAAFVGNPHLSEQEATLIPSAINVGFKYGYTEGLSGIFTYSLIQRIKECSLGQLPRYTALANAMMQETNIPFQLIAVSLFTAIRQRCQSASASDLAASQLEEKQEAPQNLSAAAAKRGLMPKPQEQQAPNNNPARQEAARADCSIS
jgi:hypothetical protein